MKSQQVRLYDLALAVMATFVVLALLLSIPPNIARLVNEKWPPLNPMDQQRNAAKEVCRGLNNLKQIQAVLQIEGEVFELLSEKAFVQNADRMNRIRIDGINDVSFGNAKLSLVQEGIGVSTDFEFTITSYDLKLGGRISGLSGVSCSSKEIMLFPAFSHVSLNQFSWSDDKKLINDLGEKAAVNFINHILRTFLDNINGALIESPVVIPLDLNFAGDINAEDLISCRGCDVVSRRDIQYKVSINSLVSHITPNMMHIIFGSKDNNEELIADENDDIFEMTASIFDSKMTESGFNRYTENIHFSVRKDYVASEFNNAFNSIDVSVTKQNFLEVPQEKQSFQTAIRFKDVNELPSCSGLREPFHGENCDSVPGLPDCNRNCPKCKKWNPWSCARALECKLEEGICIAKREAERAAKIALCKSKREIDRAEHQLKNEARVAMCKAVKEFLRTKFAELDGKFNVESSEIEIVLKQLQLSDDLTELTIVTDLSATADTNIRVHFVPKSVGHLFCYFNFRKTLNTTMSTLSRDRHVKAILSVTEGDNGYLFLKGATEEEKIDLKLSPTPYLQLIKHPDFLVNCKLLTLALPVLTGGYLLAKEELPEPLRAIMLGQYEYTLDPHEEEFMIKPIPIGFENDLRFILTPSWESDHIVFSIDTAR